MSNRGDLILVRGLPGDGKSTLGQVLASFGARHVEADQFFCLSGQYRFDPSKLHDAHTWCQDEVDYAMHHDYRLIVVTNTFTRNREMAPYVELAKNNNYRYHVVTKESGYGTVGLASRNIHNVLLETIDQMKHRWEKFCD